ncbi:ABC transporter substrate-binding protein [Georgenia sp. AZ-5]|uniref:ABC transporter substrate-binding protein n=1 Tax=Georgenia sp. AZ-5 TaxID=3367526 RepID=UPI003754F3C1
MRQRRRNHRAVAAVATIAAASMLAACGASSGQEDADGAAPSAAALEGRGPITYATGRDSSGAAADTIAKWNAAHPDEQVTMIELPDSADQQRQQLVQNAEIESDAYTVLNIDVVWVSEFAANQWLVPLPEDAFDTAAMVPAVLEAGKYRDNLYAAPYYTDGALFYYRSDLLQAAGIDGPPQTWAEMESACEAVLALPEAQGMSCYAGQLDKGEGLTVNFSEAVNSAGGAILDDDGEVAVDSPEALEGLTFLTEGLSSGLFPAESITFKEEEGRRAFQEGRLVFHRNWPGPYSSFSATDGSSQVAGKFDVAPIPGSSGPGVSTLGGHYLGISPYAPNKATALDFISFFVSEEEEGARLAKSSRAPVYASFFEDEAVVAQRPFFPMLLDSLENASPRPQVVRYGDATAAIQDEVYAALTGDKAAKDALSDLQVKLEEITAQ